MKKVLMMWGGWDGHEPQQCTEIVAEALRAKDCDVQVENSLEPLEDKNLVEKYDLIIPVWTMGKMEPEQSKNLRAAVNDGVGFAGFHGGAGDAFRGDLGYEWMTGGHFVGHPYVGEYKVSLTDVKSPITEGLPQSFQYDSEQYYMMIDPAVTVLADTIYEFEGANVTMPVVWTRTWGKGRVFYSALGHKASEFEERREVLDMTIKGMLWASR